MRIYKPEDWMNKKLDTSIIQKEVKKNASEIRTRRIGKAKELEASSVKIAQEKQSISSLLEQAQESLSKLTVSSQNKEALDRLIAELEKAYNQYEYSTRNLARRFQNAKIRVIAFGSKSQGKSSFIKSFTKLPDDIVASKTGGNDDKTGTMCIYYHKEGIPTDNPEINVVFRKPEEILSIVNKCLSQLSKAGLKINGKVFFSSWAELKEVINKNEVIKQDIYNKIEALKQSSNSPISGFLAHKETLKNIFDPKSDYSEIEGDVDPVYFDKKKGKQISKSELPMYNDMQFNGSKRFPIVSEIHVFVDLKRNNMFENIEVCDTKGISIEAGGSSWEEELYSELGNCDAAFSIQMDGVAAVGKASQTFYSDLNDEKVKHPDSLKDLNLRHYIIINPFSGAIPEEVVKNATKNGSYEIAQTLYIGALLDKIKYGEYTLDMQRFVDFVIYDMIKNIVVNTNETDKNLETALEGAKKVIDVKTTEIRKLLHEINEELPKDEIDWERDVIIPALLKKKREVEEEILKFAQKEKISLPTKKNKEDAQNASYKNSSGSVYDDDDDDDEEVMAGTFCDNNSSEEDISGIEYIPDEYEISKGIYKMITNQTLKDKESVGNQQAVELAIGYLYDKCIRIAGNKGLFLKHDIIGTAKYIGSFIDHLSSLIFKEVNENINHYFIANSDNGNLTDFKNNMFNIIWRGFYMAQFCEYQKFDIESLKEMTNSDDKKYPMLEMWVENYEKVTGDNKATCIYPRTSYAILKAYFDSVSELPSEEELRSNTHPIFKDKELRNAVISAYMFHDYVTRYKEQINNDASNKQKVLGYQISNMDVEYEYVYSLLDLYKELRPYEYGKILGECGLISSEDKAKFENQESIKTFRNITGQINSFKSSL